MLYNEPCGLPSGVETLRREKHLSFFAVATERYATSSLVLHAERRRCTMIGSSKALLNAWTCCTGFSYRDARWLPEAVAFESRPQLLRNFVQKRASHDVEEDADMVNGIHPDWLRVHRIIAKKQTVKDCQYLTKW